ncbi:RAM signaling pathway protein-domain-containing protein [Trametes polyzona]|nr:RAM signaling pathway protein-domain-containing protein [Trametes polyzona]
MSGSDGEYSLRKPSSTLKSAALSPTPSLSLTRDHITEALAKSPDGGATLDLAYKGLTDVGESGAEELATVGQDEETGTDSTVVRVALAHNRLTTLPMAFSLLSRLRYLVLKNNSFSVFPDVLTVMPSLEILDISRNKIKRLPSEPGSLVNLRVFSLSRNKLHRLPPYLAQFRQLSLLKVDQNPLEWPPPSVLDAPKNHGDPHAMGEWIRHLQAWMEENSASHGERKHSDDSMSSDAGNDSSFMHAPRDRTPLQTDLLYHTRSFSLESDTSSNFQLDRSPAPSRPQPENPPRLHLDSFFLKIAGKSGSPSPSRSPDASVSPSDESAGSNGIHAHHSRFPSHLNGHSGTRVPLKGPSVKKSMPDMRPTKLQLPNGSHRTAAASTDHLPSHHPFNTIMDEPVSASPISIDRPVPSMDTERNSYFRRLSTLSSATISKAIPESLLAVVDAVRGILFALSHIYQTLQHYTVYAIDERLSAVLLKVLGPASSYMSQLINALDKFDAISRRALPSPSICRAVVEHCRDNITVFGKAVGMLSLQLKVLAKHDDVRYTRQMLLVLYGAMSEISAAWQSMASHVDAVRPYLWDSRPPPVSKSYGSKTPTLRGTASAEKPRPAASTPPAVLSPTFSPTNETPQRVHLRTTATQRSLDLGRVHISRRHAGSFSSKDVEIGKMLPSYVDGPPPPFPPSMHGAFQHSTPTHPRTMRRLVLPLGQQGYDLQQGSHSRQGSQSSLLTAANSSPQLGGTLSGSSTVVDKEVIGAMKAAVEAAPEIWEMMDEMLDGEDPGAGTAGAGASRDDFREMLARAKDVTERLRQSIAAVQEGQGAHLQGVDGKTLHDDAHIFVKTVIQLSNALKTRNGPASSSASATGPSIPGAPLQPQPHNSALSSTLRTKIVRLTNATQEVVMLLHVSSFSPAPTPGLRSYSPMVGPGVGVGMGAGAGVHATSPLPTPTPSIEDGRLGSNISRSRSANPSFGAKLL